MPDAHHLSNVTPNSGLARFHTGDTVRVAFRVREGDRVRVQSFQGVVIREGGAGPAASFTVRRVAFDVGIERTFPRHSPLIESVTVVRQGRVRRAKLYYLRKLSGRAARVKERRGAAELLTLETLAVAPADAAGEAPVVESTAPSEASGSGEAPALQVSGTPEPPGEPARSPTVDSGETRSQGGPSS